MTRLVNDSGMFKHSGVVFHETTVYKGRLVLVCISLALLTWMVFVCFNDNDVGNVFLEDVHVSVMLGLSKLNVDRTLGIVNIGDTVAEGVWEDTSNGSRVSHV